MSTQVASPEIVPRPVLGDGTLAIESSRMRLPNPHAMSLFRGAIGGCSLGSLVAERYVTEDTIYGEGHDLLKDMDARTWGEATRIAIENGMLEVTPLEAGSVLPSLDKEAAEFCAMSTRGMGAHEILALQGISQGEVARRRKQALISAFGVPETAYAPYAAITYQYYRWGFTQVPTDAAARMVALRQQHNMRRFLRTVYTGAGFEHLPDAVASESGKKIMNILSLAGITTESKKKYRRLAAYLERGLSLEDISQEEAATFKAVDISIAQGRIALRNFTDAQGFLSLAGVKVDLPLKRLPPLSRGLRRNRQ